MMTARATKRTTQAATTTTAMATTMSTYRQPIVAMLMAMTRLHRGARRSGCVHQEDGQPSPILVPMNDSMFKILHRLPIWDTVPPQRLP